MLIQKIHRYLERHALLQTGDRVLVAYSGGADSTCLLSILTRAWNDTAAVYVNHHLRDEESEREEQFVRKFCAERNIPLYVEQIRWHKKPANLEEAARKRRYRALAKVAAENGFNKVAVAHHADDVVETFLLRLIRGAGPSGLAGLQPTRGIYIRPLLDCTRNEILMYLQTQQIPYFADTTNEQLSFQRNRIRHELIPYIQKHLNPRFPATALRTLQWIEEQNTLLSELLKPYQEWIAQKTGRIRLDTSKFKTLSIPLQKAMLRMMARMADPNLYLSSRSLQKIRETIDHGGKMELPGFLMVKSNSHTIEFSRKTGQVGYYEVDVPGVGTYHFPPANALLKFSVEKGAGYQPLTDVAYIDMAKASFPLHIRNWKRGDRFRPLGMKGTKKLSDYLIDRKVLKKERKLVPLVFKDEELIWVAGHQIDDRYRVTSQTPAVLRIEYKKNVQT